MPNFKAQGEQYGPFALSLLPIGAYEPRWFLKDIHLNPEEAVQAHLDLNSQAGSVSNFNQSEPKERERTAAAAG